MPGNGKRFAPGIDLRVLDNLKNAADAKVVIANGRRVARIPLQYVRCGLQRIQTIIQRLDRLSSRFMHRFCEGLLSGSERFGAARPRQFRPLVPHLCIATGRATAKNENGTQAGQKPAHVHDLLGCEIGGVSDRISHYLLIRDDHCCAGLDLVSERLGELGIKSDSRSYLLGIERATCATHTHPPAGFVPGCELTRLARAAFEQCEYIAAETVASAQATTINLNCGASDGVAIATNVERAIG